MYEALNISIDQENNDKNDFMRAKGLKDTYELAKLFLSKSHFYGTLKSQDPT